MDPVNVAYYACICAALAALSDRLGGIARRAAAGAAVGLVAAALLPLFRRLLGLD